VCFVWVSRGVCVCTRFIRLCADRGFAILIPRSVPFSVSPIREPPLTTGAARADGAGGEGIFAALGHAGTCGRVGVWTCIDALNRTCPPFPFNRIRSHSIIRSISIDPSQLTSTPPVTPPMPPIHASTHTHTPHANQQERGSGWRFNKVRQTWVLKHMYDEGRVDKKLFKSCVLPYVAGLQGGAREVRERVRAGDDGLDGW
jgi:hypothetical protein